MLELKNIHYSVDAPEGRTEILRDISLTIPDKKLIVLTGPNGPSPSARAAASATASSSRRASRASA